MSFFLQQGELLILIFEFYTLSVPLLERLLFSFRERAIFCCNNWGEISWYWRNESRRALVRKLILREYQVLRHSDRARLLTLRTGGIVKRWQASRTVIWRSILRWMTCRSSESFLVWIQVYTSPPPSLKQISQFLFRALRHKYAGTHLRDIFGSAICDGDCSTVLCG